MIDDFFTPRQTGSDDKKLGKTEVVFPSEWMWGADQKSFYCGFMIIEEW